MKLVATLSAALLSVSPSWARDVTPPPSPADWSIPDRELMVPVEGGRVWVRIDGDLSTDLPPAVLVHGGPGGTHTSFGNMMSLADERAVILYDQLDSGKSDHPGDPANWRVDRFVEELEAIRKALGIEKWHVIGHSWGSALALEYAAKYSQHVASSVLAGTFISTPHWITGTNLLIRELPDDVAAALIACEGPTPPAAEVCEPASKAFYSAYNGRPDRPAVTPEEKAYRERFNGKGFNPELYNAMWGPSEFSARGSLVSFNATPLLSRIDGQRTLFMIGQYDEARIDDVQEFVELAPGSELAVIPGGSHSSFHERPAESEAILRAWMRRHDPQDAAP
ncbi:proline iminopeptidase-family hydrolase [Qipengyuania sp. MTN3-11]|uniref:proline iminopeptidase-family hydrolase n=1 Tax=Qipengyuania sp. MTN3-11 TaxID=3056557 RepID=UPI0036F436AA